MSSTRCLRRQRRRSGGSPTYTLGGTISGLKSASGLTLSSNGQSFSPDASAGVFTFPTAVSTGTHYSVTVTAQPSGQYCSVGNGSGNVMNSNVTNVEVTCINVYSVGGSISGLTADGLVLINGTDSVAPSIGATTFTLPTPQQAGATYSLTVQTQAAGLFCKLTNSSGTVGQGPVTNIQVACSQPQWVWQGGSNDLGATGVYGTQGVAAPDNIPGARAAAVAWRSASGIQWLFGGTGIDGYGIPATAMNDLWAFNPTTGQWTWVSGTIGSSAAGIYGTKGVAAATNAPGARTAAVHGPTARETYGSLAGTDTTRWGLPTS